ncbi:hypothetical protein Poli38472_013722 [Pythium oligandrum]|uniref:Uncharacterized protein n=1 Tax=Pythium oligandrum TaxID=41045 RepID=A0A8K1FHQ5_PYTOL|nr:hypothetical protein Poli38472_013722 [Pythium oligandrum]|eukprot:TMW61259.1 hypothetical protein Poli38472_013722 [Pythium oligandrum]
MVSKSVDELEVDLNISQYSLSCQYEWCWLFYTLFNGASARSVTTLRLNATDILMDDFIQVRKLVRSRNPLEMLLDLDLDEEMEADGRPQRPESTLSRPAQVIVRDGTPVYLDILRSQHPLILSSGSRVFDVMHELNDAYDILVPGYGQCWVTKEDVAVEIPRSEENARDRWRLETHPITKLSVTMNRSVLEERDQTGLRVLLKLIGTPIKQLSLGCEWHEGLDPSLLDFVWSSCPNIVYLSVGNMSLDSFDDIVAAYASGRCQVSELSLTECNPFDTESPVAFVKKLADPKTPISKTLHQLHLGLSDVTDRFMPNEVLEAFLTMLETNERLRFLQLEVGEDQIDSYNPRFAAFRGQTIRYPLAWSTKCAFLSVVKHVQHFDSVDRVIPPIGRLDSLSLSRIFAFAGGFHTRSVV